MSLRHATRAGIRGPGLTPQRVWHFVLLSLFLLTIASCLQRSSSLQTSAKAHQDRNSYSSQGNSRSSLALPLHTGVAQRHGIFSKRTTNACPLFAHLVLQIHKAGSTFSRSHTCDRSKHVPVLVFCFSHLRQPITLDSELHRRTRAKKLHWLSATTQITWIVVSLLVSNRSEEMTVILKNLRRWCALTHSAWKDEEGHVLPYHCVQKAHVVDRALPRKEVCNVFHIRLIHTPTLMTFPLWRSESPIGSGLGTQARTVPI